MEKKPSAALLDHFAHVPDARIARHRWHKLSDLLVSAVCAVLCGAASFPASEDFGHAREEGLNQVLELPEGIPAHDTFKRVLGRVDPVQVQACFLSWRHAVADTTAGEVVAIAGKALRRAFANGAAKRAIPMVRAWATANGVVLGQRKVDAKSTEIPAIPEFLAQLALKGGSVTREARSCQRTIARQIVEQGADYVLALKGKPPRLEQAVAHFVVTGPEAEAHRTGSESSEQTEQGHGRGETRC